MKKKLVSFLFLFLVVVGIIGGIGYALYHQAYPIALGVAVLTYMAWPKIKEYFINLTM
jgi:MFS superfamily sulfate permease-like transporter